MKYLVEKTAGKVGGGDTRGQTKQLDEATGATERWK